MAVATRPLRVNLFPNGELSGGKALLVPTTWADFTTSAAAKLKLTGTPVRIYTAEGGELSEIDELLPEDQLFVVEKEEEFRTPGSGPRPQTSSASEETEPIEPIARPSVTVGASHTLSSSSATSSSTLAASSTAAPSVATPPPIAHPPRAALPIITGSSAENRRNIFRQQEPQLLRLQSLMPGVALSEVLTAISFSDNHVPTAITFLTKAHPTAESVTDEDLVVGPARIRERFDASILSKGPVAPRVRARQDFGAAEMNVRDVVGARFSMGEIRNALRVANGNVETAILQLLNQDIP